MADKTHIDITGIILSGGKSSRMGTDKGFVMWENKQFVQYSIDALQPIVNEIIIVSDYEQYDVLGYKRIKDDVSDAGPLSGLYSGLKESKTALNLVLSCDVPLITSEVVKKLVATYQEGMDAVVCRADGRIMPLIAMYTKKSLKACEELLKAGEYRMMHLLKTLDQVTYITLNKEQSRSVKNINSPKDLNDIKNAN